MPILRCTGGRSLLYFKPADPGADIYDVLQDLKQSATADKNKIRFFIVTDFQNIAAYDTKADDYLECAYTDLAQKYGFFFPLAGLEKSSGFEENPADTKAAEKMGRLFDHIRRQKAERMVRG